MTCMANPKGAVLNVIGDMEFVPTHYTSHTGLQSGPARPMTPTGAISRNSISKVATVSMQGASK